MRPDDVERAVGTLTSQVTVPTVDAASVIAAGHRRIAHRRAVVAAVSVALLATIATVGALAGSHHTTDVASHATAPTTAPTRVTTESGGPPLHIAVASADEAWKCTSPLQYTDNGGRTWRSIATPRTDRAGAGNSNALCTAVANGNAWAVRFPGGPRPGPVVRVRDGVQSEITPFPRVTPETDALSVTFLDAERGWIVTTFNGPNGSNTPARDLYRTLDGGGTWKLVGNNVPVTGGLQFTSPTRGWALASAFDLVTTNDGGATWRRMTLPDAPEGAFLAQVVAKGATVVVWRGAVVGPTTPAFFDVSTDGGRTWSRRPSPARLNMTGAAPLGFAAVDAAHWRFLAGPLWVTDDGGRTWIRRPTPPIASADSLSFPTPDVGWISGNAAGSTAPVLLRTTDAGRSWTDLTNVLPLLPPVTRGGIVGCPTRPLTPGAPGRPPPGLVPAAIAYTKRNPLWTGRTVRAVYKIGYAGAGPFGTAISDNVSSCGESVAGASWIVELNYPNTRNTSALVLAHDAGGWRVFGSYQ